MKRHGLSQALYVGIWVASAAQAQAPRSGGSESQRMMQQYQQLAAEKTALQAQLAQTKKDLDGAQTELAAAKKDRDALKLRSTVSSGAAAQLSHANQARDTAEKNLTQSKQRTQELVDRFKETIGSLKTIEADRAGLQRENVNLNAKLDRCAGDNVELFDISNSVLDRYDRVGLLTKVSTAEPFTRLTRTRIDNLVIEYQARAEAARVKKAGAR